MINIQIAGHLGADPETRYTPAGLKVTSFRVATNIKRGQKEKTIWWKVTCWGDRFDKKLAYLKKGSAVITMGEMNIPEIYTDKDGNQQTSFEITADMIQFSPFGTGRGGERSENPSAEPNEMAAQKAPSPQNYSSANMQIDDLPF